MTTLSLCSALWTDLPDRQFGPEFVRNQIQQLRRSIRGLEREGLRHVFVLSRGWRKCQCLKMGQNESMRPANHTVDGGREAGLEIVGSVSGGPCSGRERGDALDGRVSEAGQDFGQIIAHRKLEPAAAFDDR
jgi:hypothetical protein